MKEHTVEGEGVRTQAMNQTRAISVAFSRHDVTRRKARTEAGGLPRHLEAIGIYIYSSSFPKYFWLKEILN